MHQYRQVGTDGWYQKDTVRFDIPTIQGDFQGNLNIGLRLNNDFRYQRIWVVLEQRWKETSLNRKDTLTLDFTNAEGEFSTTGTNLMEFTDKVCDVRLAPQQEGTILIYHLMHMETVPSIREVGISINR